MPSVVDTLIPFFTVLIIAMLPIVELRGAIPVAVAVYHFHPAVAFSVALLGNMLPVPFIILFLQPLEKLTRKINLVDRFLNWLYKKTRRKTTNFVEKYKYAGLCAIVAVPLPGTGAWTGCLVAHIFGLERYRTFCAITLGVIIAGVLVTLATVGFLRLV